METEALHHLIADAHKSVIRPGDPYEPVPLIDEIVERLTAAKVAFLAGDKRAASKHFDPNYEPAVA